MTTWNGTAFILVGGLGTRLRAVVGDRPKPLAEINGRPFLLFLLEQLARAGVTDTVLCTGFKAELVRAELGQDFGKMRLRYSEEDKPLGTGGALGLALARHGPPGTALVLNGDSYCDADLPAYFRWFASPAKIAGMLLVKMEDCRRFGRVEIDAQGHVVSFQEKSAQLESGWINGGIYLLSAEALKKLPVREVFSLEKDYFPTLTGQGLCGWPATGRFIDIGTPESYREAGEFFRQVAPAAPPERR